MEVNRNILWNTGPFSLSHAHMVMWVEASRSWKINKIHYVNCLIPWLRRLKQATQADVLCPCLPACNEARASRVNYILRGFQNFPFGTARQHFELLNRRWFGADLVPNFKNTKWALGTDSELIRRRIGSKLRIILKSSHAFRRMLYW